MGRGRYKGNANGQKHEPGWESLRNFVYKQAASDYRNLRQQGYPATGVRKFLLSGAYQMDPQIGEEIIRRLEAEYVD